MFCLSGTSSCKPWGLQTRYLREVLEISASSGSEEPQASVESWLKSGGKEVVDPVKGALPKFKKKYWPMAITWFDQALIRFENYLIVLYRKGYAHTQLNERDAAINAFEKCITIWKNLNDQDKEKEKKSYSDTCFQLGCYASSD